MTEKLAIEESALDHIWFHVTSPQALRAPGGMTVFTKGEGCYLTDIHGNEYLDGLSGGAFVTAIGHGRKEVADAMAKQAAELAYVTPYNFAAPPTIALAEKLRQISPGDLHRAFFTSGGTEAVETAVKIAKQYQWLRGEQKRTKVISRRGSYHGSSFYTMSMSGASHDFNSKIFAPMVPGCVQTANHNCYRCEFGMTQPSCNIHCAKSIEQAVLHEGPETVAAIIAEPIPASASIYLPPDGYLAQLREIADKYGIVLILDEVINGFGRTGKMFASEHWGVVPDIMTVAKGLTSGYAPMGAVMVSPKITSAFDGASGRESGLNHVISFGGHATAAAAALKNIEILETEGMVENSAAMGQYLLDGLETLKKYPIVGDIRGKGLLTAVELVQDKKSRAMFPPSAGMMVKVTNKLREHGVLARTYQVVEFGPPLCAGKREIEKIVEAMEKTIIWFGKETGLQK